MSIQAGINQSIGNIGFLVGMNPSLRSLAEKRSQLNTLKRKKEVLAQQHELATEHGPSPEAEFLTGDEQRKAMGVVDINIAEKAQSGLREVAKAEFDIEPSKETYGTLVQSEYGIHPAVSPESAERYKTFKQYIQKAQDATVAKQAEKRAGRRNFMSYLKNEPIQHGITVANLSPDAQKQIASKFSKSQRKEFMNRKDAANVKK